MAQKPANKPKKEKLKEGDTVFLKGRKKHLAMILTHIRKEEDVDVEVGTCMWIDNKTNEQRLETYPTGLLTKKKPPTTTQIFMR